MAGSVFFRRRQQRLARLFCQHLAASNDDLCVGGPFININDMQTSETLVLFASTQSWIIMLTPNSRSANPHWCGRGFSIPGVPTNHSLITSRSNIVAFGVASGTSGD